MLDCVRIVFVGDEGVGKSSLINACMTGEYSPNVDKNVGMKEFSASSTPDNVRLEIVDTDSFSWSGSSQEKAATLVELKKANVVCLVFDLSKEATMNSVASNWLPWLASPEVAINVPVLLVGNKLDLQEDDKAGSQDRVERFILPLMSKFKEIETAIECSAKTLQNLPDVFRYAQMSVLHPTRPIYDTNLHRLKPSCEEALKRVFRIIDRNRDGLLDDDEMSKFQEYCFGEPLSANELVGVKKVVQSQCPDGFSEGGMTEVGFIFLHTLFIHRGRMETTWTVLRRFGYSDEGEDLQFDPEYLLPSKYRDMESMSVELSDAATRYLEELYRSVCAQFKTATLSTAALDDIFKVAPHGSPVAPTMLQSVARQPDGSIALGAFLSLWSLLCVEDYKKVIRFLAYLGFDPRLTQSLKIFKTRRARAKGRTVHCLVAGAPKSGKTTFVSRLVGGAADSARGAMWGDFRRSADAVASLDKILVLSELAADTAHRTLSTPTHPVMETCDCVVLLVDPASGESMQFADKALAALMNAPIPVLVLRTFADKGADAGALVKLCADAGIAAPAPSGCDKPAGSELDVYRGLCEAVAAPDAHFLMSQERRKKRRSATLASTMTATAVAVAALGALATAGLLVWRWVASRGADSADEQPPQQ